MNLKGILSIVTYPGLYRHVAQAKNGLIIESIVDGKRSLAYATSRISALEDISIYTSNGDTKLSKVYEDLFKELDGKPTSFNPKKASNDELTGLFTKVLPDWDKDRVYVSDIKRAFVWYNLLVEKGVITAENVSSEEKKEDKKDEKPAEQPQEEGITVKKRTRKKKTEEDKK